MTTIERIYETVVVGLCGDCLMLTANGETEGVGGSCYWSELPRDHDHNDRCWNPTPDEAERRETAFVAATERLWPTSDGWSIAPGCSDECEHCHGGHPEIVCGLCEGDGYRWSTISVDGVDVFYDCPACDGDGYTVDESTTVDQCEPTFSWSACDGCGSHLGGNRSNGTAMREVID